MISSMKNSEPDGDGKEILRTSAPARELPQGAGEVVAKASALRESTCPKPAVACRMLFGSEPHVRPWRVGADAADGRADWRMCPLGRAVAAQWSPEQLERLKAALRPELPSHELLPGMTLGPRRVVAIGGLHGRPAVLDRALLSSKLINDRGQWVGYETVLVQTGDIFHRGVGEAELLERLIDLKAQAIKYGGAFVWLMGDHDQMAFAARNGDETEAEVHPLAPAGYVGSDLARMDPPPEHVTSPAAVRNHILRPGGRVAKELVGTHPIACVIEGTLFAHGGLLMGHLPDIASLNARARAWLHDGGCSELRLSPLARFSLSAIYGPPAFHALDGPASMPMGERSFGHAPADELEAPSFGGHNGMESWSTADELGDVLNATGAARMVVSQCVQPSHTISKLCRGKLWCTDTGMWRRRGAGRIQALEVNASIAKVMNEDKYRLSLGRWTFPAF
jgi:hypothetical protein